jgi:hypothetical protein
VIFGQLILQFVESHGDAVFMLVATSASTWNLGRCVLSCIGIGNGLEFVGVMKSREDWMRLSSSSCQNWKDLTCHKFFMATAQKQVIGGNCR